MNGHHQQNGVENMMLFEVVKMGKSAMQVRRGIFLRLGWVYRLHITMVFHTDDLLK